MYKSSEMNEAPLAWNLLFIIDVHPSESMVSRDGFVDKISASFKGSRFKSKIQNDDERFAVPLNEQIDDWFQHKSNIHWQIDPTGTRV